MATSLLVWT